MKLNRKNKFLVLSFFLVLFISYRFAISNTISTYNDYQLKSKTILDNTLNEKATTVLLQREKQLDTLLSGYSLKTSFSFQNELLQKLNSFCIPHSLKIVSFQEPHVVKNSMGTTTNYIFSVSGSFNGCISLLNKIENNPSLGIVNHVGFIKKKNYKTNQDNLSVEIHLQHNKTS